MTSSPIVAGIDPGIFGGIAIGNAATPMPVTRTLIKEAITVLDLKDGKKQFYKSGPNKGEPKKRIKTAAKHKTELDVKAIFALLAVVDILVIETPGTSFGNAARSTSTVNKNYGKILAVAELCNCKIIPVAPAKWKKDMKLSKEKLDSVIVAEDLTGLSFRTSRGALLDGMAEAVCLVHWYKTHYKGEV